MPDLTRRKFLTGAPTVAAVAVAGAALAAKTAPLTRPVVRINPRPRIASQIVRGPVVGTYDIATDRIITQEIADDWMRRRLQPFVRLL